MGLTGLAFRNLFRNRFRGSMTILGVAVAILCFVTLRSVVTAGIAGAELAAKDRIVTRQPKVSPTFTLPKHYVDKLRSIPDVKVATFASWFDGKHPKHPDEFITAIGVDVRSFFDVYDDFILDDEAKRRWLEDRRGAMVGDLLAKKHGWKVGDTVRLVSAVYPANWEFRIAAIYSPSNRGVERYIFGFHWDYFNGNVEPRLRDQVSWIISRASSPSKVAAACAAIDHAFADTDIQTISQNEREFSAALLGSMAAMLRLVDVISLVIIFIMLLVLGNTIAMGARERTSEYGTLRAIGFRPRHVVYCIITEAVVTGGAGGVLGLAIGYPFAEGWIGPWLEENVGTYLMYFYFHLSLSMMALALALALGLGLVAALAPALRVWKLKTVDALRQVG